MQIDQLKQVFMLNLKFILQIGRCACAFMKFESRKSFKVVLRCTCAYIYLYTEHVLFQKESGKFEILSWLISYELFS